MAMRIMAIDYGDARTGIAICDKLEMLASPLCVIQQNKQKSVERIIAIAKDECVELIVLGYPKNMDASIGSRAKISEDLAKLIEDLSDIKVVLWDERLSTVSAHESLNSANVRGKKRKKIIDEVAATIILQDYLNFRRMNK